MSTPLDDPQRLPVRDIMCIDCKSFYASTEAIRRAEYPLAAKIAVLSRAQSQGGLILAASPDTKRDYGVKLGTRNYEIKPHMDIELVAPHMGLYIEQNYRINQIFRRFTDDAHHYVYSVDEAFVDVTHSHALFGSNEKIAEKIQTQVFNETGIITSVGIGPNPLMAKLALDNAAKEAAPWRAEWTYDQVPETVWQIKKLTDFWSIGDRTAKKLEAMGIHSIYELAHTPRSKLKSKFGVLGDALYFHAWGIDYSDLAKQYVPREENRGYDNNQVLLRDYVTQADIETVLFETADHVGGRLRSHRVQAEVVGISVGFSQPDEHGHRGWSAQTQVDPTNDTNHLIRAVKYLFESRWEGQALRNIGVRVNRISKESSFQTSLFDPVEQHETNWRLEHTIDQIRNRYGYKALIRGYSKKEAGTAVYRSGLLGGHQAWGAEQSGALPAIPKAPANIRGSVTRKESLVLLNNLDQYFKRRYKWRYRILVVNNHLYDLYSFFLQAWRDQTVLVHSYDLLEFKRDPAIYTEVLRDLKRSTQLTIEYRDTHQLVHPGADITHDNVHGHG